MGMFDSIKNAVSENKALCAIGAITAGVIAWIVNDCKERSKEIEEDCVIVDMSWSRTIDIQAIKTVKESDWTVPRGAKVYNTNWEFKKMIKVPSGVDANGLTTYREQPEYATKYYYEVDKYVTDRTLRFSNHGPLPSNWDVPDIAPNEKKRLGKLNCTITVRMDDGTLRTYNIDQYKYGVLNIGDYIRISTNGWDRNKILSISMN